MALKEKVSHDELLLLEILRNPVLCMEFVNNFDKTEKDDKFEFSWYQKEWLLDFSDHVAIRAGRASGKCLDSSCMIMNSSTGEYKSVKDWYNLGSEFNILAIDDNWKQKSSIGRIEPNGIQDCIEIKSRKGFSTIVTNEHPILTNTGFKRADKLAIGDYIAIPNKILYTGTTNLCDEEIIAAAHFIAEGTYHTGGITTTSLEVVDDLKRVAKHFDRALVLRDKITYYITGGIAKSKSVNPYLRFLETLGLRNCHSYDKFIPQEIFRLPYEKLGLFLNRLFSDDGWCICNNNRREIGYATTSERLAKDIHHILLRFGIVSSLSHKNNKKRGCWTIGISGNVNIENYFNNIGFFIEYKQENLKNILRSSSGFLNQSDILPIPNYYDYKYKRTDNKSGTLRNLLYMPTRKKANIIENKDDNVYKFINADIFWVTVEELNILSNRETYSVEVDKYSTLIADNIYSHNTVSMVSMLVWILLYNLFPGEYVVFHVPNKVHLDPVWSGLVRSFRSNTFLKEFIPSSSGINSSDFKITLISQATLICRLAGQTGTGISVIGLHQPLCIIDEAGFYPYNTFIEMQPTLNTFTPGYRMIVAGTPSGLREKNVLYTCDQTNSSYSKHHISSIENPRFTESDRLRAVEQYGGEDSEDYIHHVLGKHGKPVFSLFDRSMMDINNYPSYRLVIDGKDLSTNLTEYYNKIRMFPGLPDRKQQCFIGIDLGYTEPTAIIIMYMDQQGRLKFHGRIQLNSVSYTIQERIIDELDNKFDPFIIGIDFGGVGRPVVNNLKERPEYAHKNYTKRMTEVDFSSNIVLGIDANGQEIKEKTKPFATSVLQDYSNNHKIVYTSTDLELVTELERMTYSKTPSGEIVYRTLTVLGGKKGADHFTSALLCATLAYYLNSEFILNRQKRKRLMSFSWLG